MTLTGTIIIIAVILMWISHEILFPPKAKMHFEKMVSHVLQNNIDRYKKIIEGK